MARKNGRKAKQSDASTSQQDAQPSNQPDLPIKKKKKKKKNKAGAEQQESNGTKGLSKAEKRKIRKVRAKAKKEVEAPLATVMKKYLGKSMPGKAFCRAFLKGYNLKNDQLIDALETPLGPQIEQELRDSGKKSYEFLAEKVKAALKVKDLNKNGKPKPIPNSQDGLEAFAGNLNGLLAQMRGEIVSMNKERRAQASSNNFPSWHYSGQPNSINQRPSTSAEDNFDDDFVEDRKPMDEQNDLKPADITKRYSQLQFRCDELIRYNPNNVQTSDCDQSGSDEELEDFNKYFERQLQSFEQKRKLEIVRNRPFGVRKPNNFRTNNLPSNSFKN